MTKAIIQVDVNDFYREDVEGFEGANFEDASQAVDTIRKSAHHEITAEDNAVFIYSLTDFVDMCNNEEFDVENSWVTWVNIKDDSTL